MLSALKGVLKNAGKSVSPIVISRVVSTLQEFLQSDEDEIRGSAARALGMVSQVCQLSYSEITCQGFELLLYFWLSSGHVCHLSNAELLLTMFYVKLWTDW